MISSVILEILIQQFVAWRDHQSGTQLLPTAAGVALPVPSCSSPKTSPDLGRLHEIESAQRIGADRTGRRAVFVQQHIERDSLIFDEGLGVPLPTSTDGNDACARRQELVVSIADLTGPLAACQSAEMAKKQHHLGILFPSVAEPLFGFVGADQHLVGELGYIEWHRDLTLNGVGHGTGHWWPADGSM